MQVQVFILSLLFLLLGDEVHGLVRGGEAAAGRGGGGGGTGLAQAVYVFGDSYVDTGNHDPNSPDADIAKPWKPPYGSTWPGQPAGRWSDGRVFTDFYVSRIHGKEPIPFREIDISAGKWLGNTGINFAFGGSGVFSTSNPLILNVSTQIEQLRTTIDLGIVSAEDLSQSQVLFVISGNDYFSYAQTHPNFTGIQDLILQVVEQMAVDLEILSEIGFKRFVVSNIAPLGCVPYITSAYNYSTCDDMLNNACTYHNSVLESQISNLQATHTNTTFVTIDLYNAFEKVVEGGTLSLRPCCEGECGIFDENGTALYTLCSNLEATLYWDLVHPTNFVWKELFNTIFSLQAT